MCVFQIDHAKVCEEYQDQMKELEEILAAGPAAMNISVEQLAKQVRTACELLAFYRLKGYEHDRRVTREVGGHCGVSTIIFYP